MRDTHQNSKKNRHDLPRHEMRLEGTDQFGAEEWSCPKCGRRIIVQSPPNYEKLTLERGEKYVLAWGSRIGTAVCTKTVLKAGDLNPVHFGNKPAQDLEVTGSTWPNENNEQDAMPSNSIGHLPVWDDLTANENDVPLSEDWRAWLEEAGFDQWWTRGQESSN